MQCAQRAVEQREGQADAAVVELHGAELAFLARLVGERRQHDARHPHRPKRRVDALRGVDEPAAHRLRDAHFFLALGCAASYTLARCMKSRWVYTCVVPMLEWPSISCTARRSPEDCSTCEAKE